MSNMPTFKIKVSQNKNPIQTLFIQTRVVMDIDTKNGGIAPCCMM